VTGGALHSCGLDAAGGWRCWGDNADGQLGTGDTIDRDVPEPPPMPPDPLLAVVAGARHTCGIRALDSSVLCWGDNTDGQLGTGDTTARSTPAAVASTIHADALAAGDHTTCAIVAGALYCWGAGTTSAPSRVGSDGDWREVAVGLAHTCATKTDDSLWCWGENGEGQLGQDDTDDRPDPTRVPLPAGARSVTVAMGHTCAATIDGRLYCWGRGLEGQLGQGDTLPQRRPQQVCF